MEVLRESVAQGRRLVAAAALCCCMLLVPVLVLAKSELAAQSKGRQSAAEHTTDVIAFNRVVAVMPAGVRASRSDASTAGGDRQYLEVSFDDGLSQTVEWFRDRARQEVPR